MKVLILKPSSLGDIIHALPVLRLIKRQRPDWQVHWWIAEPFASLLERDTDIAALHPFHRRGWGTPAGLTKGLAGMAALGREKFDVVIDLQGLARSALHGWAANGAYTIGLHQHRDGAAAWYDASVERPGLRAHAVDWCRAVLPELGLEAEGEFDWLPPRSWLAEQLDEQGHDPTARWIALCPGARWETKRWPIKHFVSLRDQLMGTPNTCLVVLGGKDDAGLGRELAGERVLDLTGQTTLPELVEWLRACAVLVTNDSGPMHIAAALGTPVVALFGPTDPERTGPYRANGAVLQQMELDCVPCLARHCEHAVERTCLRDISPSNVAEAVAACG